MSTSDPSHRLALPALFGLFLLILCVPLPLIWVSGGVLDWPLAWPLGALMFLVGAMSFVLDVWAMAPRGG